MRRAVVFGAGGFIGSHLVRRLKEEGYWVRGVDTKHPYGGTTHADDFVEGDLRQPSTLERVIEPGLDELYQMAADMGGAGYVFTGDNDANVMLNSSLINLYSAKIAQQKEVGKVFYSSSACAYPKHNQEDPEAPCCEESTAYPADPDSEYGWEKLYAERVYAAFRKNYGLDVRIARFHNIYGPGNPWKGGREKAPGALCRKVCEAEEGGEIEVWGDGKQTRSFLYVDDCVNGIRALMNSQLCGPANIGSEEMVSINELAALIVATSGKNLTIRNMAGPVGVRGRNSDNRLMQSATAWQPGYSLEEGIGLTYRWVASQIEASVVEGERAPSFGNS